MLNSLVFKEFEVQHDDGTWFLMRIHPYRTADNVIDGLVITFDDVSQGRRMRTIMRDLDHALNAADGGIASVDRGHVYQWCLGKVFGSVAAEDNLVASEFPLEAEDAAAVSAIEDEAFDRAEAMRVDVHLPRRDETYVVQFLPVVADNGSVERLITLPLPARDHGDS